MERERKAQPLAIVVVAILKEKRSSATAALAAILESALEESDSFYNYDEPRLSLLNAKFSTGKGSTPDKLGVNSIDDSLVEKARGKYLGLYDQYKLIVLVRKLIGDRFKNDKLLIVTDLQITPPAKFRYILWEKGHMNAVISLAPMNPEYWGLKELDPLVTIKHRVRTACIHIIGLFLGLNRCENPNCFLFADVVSATTLDGMICLGEEHGLRQLANRGFSTRPKEPIGIQSIHNFSGQFKREAK